jgi:hypothetical protein
MSEMAAALSDSGIWQDDGYATPIHWLRKEAKLATGVAWGLFLETFQLMLYPGWLKIGFLDEFRRISFGAHLVFGAGLGLMVPYGLRRAQPEAAIPGIRP